MDAKRVRKMLWTLVVAMVLAGLVACGAQPDTQTTPPTQDNESQPQPGKSQVFALVVKDKTNPYMQRMYDGFLAACEEMDVTAVLEGPDTANIPEQILAVERLMDADVDAIAIAANDVDALEEVLQSAMQQGIQVISLDSAVNARSRKLHIQQANPEMIGRVLIQAACTMIDYDGDIAVLSATEQATNQNLWINWMERELLDYPDKYNKVRIVDIVYGDDEPATSKEKTVELLNNYPELDIIIAPTVVGMLAAGQVIREEESGVLFTGLGLPSDMETYIKDGTCPWMYLWNPIDIGYLAAYTSKALVAGDIDAKEGDSFSAGKLGIKVVTEAFDGGGEVLFANPFKFDINNIAEWKGIY